MALTSEFTRSYNSFGGVDIKATFGTQVVGSLQGISYTIQREKAPIFTMGSADLRAVGRGKRFISGSLVFIQFDSEPLLTEIGSQTRFLADVDDLRPEYMAGPGGQMPVAGTSVAAGVPGSPNFPGASAGNQESDVGYAGSDQMAATPWYADQILPIDVVLTAASEYGALAIMKVLGVELLNGGWGVSVDDIVCEHSYTYIARGIIPWLTQGRHLSM
jgi:hypothetical protein